MLIIWYPITDYTGRYHLKVRTGAHISDHVHGFGCGDVLVGEGKVVWWAGEGGGRGGMRFFMKDDCFFV